CRKSFARAAGSKAHVSNQERAVKMANATPELVAFLETLRRHPLFERGAALTISRAPGRLDVMGGIADYSGSLVLQRPIAEATFAAVQRIDRPLIEIQSLGRSAYTIALDALGSDGVPTSYDEARSAFADAPADGRWPAYIVGVFLLLARERGMPLS